MRILQVTKFYAPHPGGIETHVRQLSETLAEEHDVTVVAFGDEPGTSIERIGGVKVIRAGVAMSIHSQPLSLRFLQAIEEEEADILQIHMPNPLAAFGVLRVTRRAPIVVTHHADVSAKSAILSVVARAYYQRLLARARVVLCATERLVSSSSDLARYREKVRVVPFWVDAEALRPATKVRAAARRYRALRRPGEHLVAFVGRMVPYKGLDVLLQAAAHLPSTRILLAGGGPQRASLEALAASLGVAERVNFLGQVSDEEKAGVLHACDAFCFPSVSTAEAFGFAQVEAQLCAKPLVTSRLHTGVTEVAVENETALCFEPGNALELAAALRRLSADSALARRLGAAGRAHAVANYTRSAARGRILSLFAELGRADHVPAQRLAPA